MSGIPIGCLDLYLCQLCKKTTQPHTPSHQLILKTKITQFPKREKAYRISGPHAKHCQKGQCACWDRGGVGTQIVKAITICPTCFDSKNLPNSKNHQHSMRKNPKTPHASPAKILSSF